VRLETVDAPDVVLHGTALGVDESGAPLGPVAVDGLTGVLARAGVPEGPGYRVVLEAMSTEDRVTSSVVGGEGVAVRSALVTTTWRVEDAAGTVVDRLDRVGTVDRWESRAETAQEALAALPTTESATTELAASAGCAMAHRLATVRTAVVRRVYGGGPLAVGARAIHAGDPDHARVELQAAADGAAGARWVARAHHDLAVAWEMAGVYGKALGEARLAGDADYVEALEALVREHRPLLRDPTAVVAR
jgi:hypothetical protein